MRARKSTKESRLGDRAKPMVRSPRVTRWVLAPEIEAELAEIAAAAGCELANAEWKGGVLRLVLDRPAAATAPADAHAEPAAPADTTDVTAGVTLGDCEHVAKQASALLDVLDFGNGRYLLEVSSPGLDRQLYRPSDYQRFLGRLARVTFEAPAADTGVSRRRTVVARLAEFHAQPAPGIPGSKGALGMVTLIDDRTGERLELKLEDVRQARLEIEL
jgi:ribosome maturation factor RimP